MGDGARLDMGGTETTPHAAQVMAAAHAQHDAAQQAALAALNAPPPGPDDSDDGVLGDVPAVATPVPLPYRDDYPPADLP